MNKKNGSGGVGVLFGDHNFYNNKLEKYCTEVLVINDICLFLIFNHIILAIIIDKKSFRIMAIIQNV